MNFGAFAASRENDVIGTVERVVLDLTTNEVLHYVVHKTLNVEKDIIVPISAVSDLNDALVLNLSLRDIESLPDYVTARRQGIGLTPYPSAAVSDVQTAEISNRTKVECTDGELGFLEGVIVDEFTAEVTDLVVRVEGPRQSVTVPFAWAESIRSDKIKLQCSQRDV